MSFENIFLAFRGLLEDGGFVMPPLLLCTAMLWYGLGYRYVVLRPRKSGNIRDLLDQYVKDQNTSANHIIEQAIKVGLKIKLTGVSHLPRHLDEAFFSYLEEIRRFSTLIKAVVVVAPLLGLLGTVTGMIETFDSLAEMALFTQSGGIAGGISQALITTQMGLAVAIPGVLMQSGLTRKQRQVERELKQIKSLLCSLNGLKLENGQ